MRPATIIVPAHEIETYIANGWCLVDEPTCPGTGARMLPPTGKPYEKPIDFEEMQAAA